MNFTIGGVLFIIPVYVQEVLGADPLTTGLTLIPMSVAIFIMSTAAGKLSTRIQPRYILALGSLASMAGSVYISLIFNPYTTILDLVPGIFLLGVGMGIGFPHSTMLYFLLQDQIKNQLHGYYEYRYKSWFIPRNSCFRRDINRWKFQ